MNTGLPPARRIFVIAPHPDDESLGCGGMIALYSQSGATVELLVVSDGAALEEPDGQHPDLAAARRQEVTNAAAILGIHRVYTISLPDGQLAQHRSTVTQTLRQHLSSFHPELVLAPSPIDGHPDHVAVGCVALQLFRELPGWQLGFYEVLAPLHFNWLVDITEVMDRKEQAALCYQRSLFGQPRLFWEAFRALNSFKSAFVHHPGFFEALWILHAPLSDQEVLAWTTYGFQPQDKENLTLWSVKEIDEVLFALQEKNAALDALRQQYAALTEENATLQDQLREQTERNTLLQQTREQPGHDVSPELINFRTWARRYLRYLFEHAFPIGSPRRNALQRYKRQISQYTSKSPSE
ncbi:MAG: PIG-L family deacetylase [Candidatus Binatia bacterium]